MTQLQATDRDIRRNACETCVRRRNRNFTILQRRGGHQSWGILRLLLCVATFVFAFGHHAIASDLTAPIEQLDAGLLQVMKAGKSAPFKQRYDVLAPLVTRAVDLDAILEGGVGSSWASLPFTEQAALKTAFQRYSIATYVSHFDEFAGERFDLYAPAASRNPVVQVKIVPGKAGDDTHILGYAMRQTPVGWKAIDVTADSSISQVVAQQDEIRSLMRNGGVDGLLARLQQKTAELSEGAVR
jgi:phospholipid transport system substrate-binding protein